MSLNHTPTLSCSSALKLVQAVQQAACNRLLLCLRPHKGQAPAFVFSFYLCFLSKYCLLHAIRNTFGAHEASSACRFEGGLSTYKFEGSQGLMKIEKTIELL